MVKDGETRFKSKLVSDGRSPCLCSLTEAAPLWSGHICPIYCKANKKWGQADIDTVHIKVTFSLDTDSLILALRQLITRQGSVWSIYSDNGSNFIGAERELRKDYEEMDDDKIQSIMQEHGGYWIRGIRILHLQATWVVYGRDKSYHPEQYYHRYWKHMGKVWKMSLSLHWWQWWKVYWTPDTVETINDTTSFQPLSPINLMTMKSKVVSPPPGKFLNPDVYSKRHWRHIQHIANKFWSPWRRDLQSLEERQKWTSRRRNFRVDDIVLLKQSDVPQNQWSVGRVIDI